MSLGAIMDLDEYSSLSEDEMPSYITDFLRSEIKKSIQNLDSKIENYVKRVELPEAINECIKKKLPLCLCPTAANVDPKTLPVSDHEEVEVTVEFRDNNAHLRQLPVSEVFAFMERRISFLEARIAALLQSKGFRNNASSKLKIEKDPSEQERSIEQRLAAGENGDTVVEESVKKPEKKSKAEFNSYDDLYYEWRQKKLNEMHFKNSGCDFRHMEEIEGAPSINKNCFVHQFIKSQGVLE